MRTGNILAPKRRDGRKWLEKIGVTIHEEHVVGNKVLYGVSVPDSAFRRLEELWPKIEYALTET